jgi:hypothetical protein
VKKNHLTPSWNAAAFFHRNFDRSAEKLASSTSRKYNPMQGLNEGRTRIK